MHPATTKRPTRVSPRTSSTAESSKLSSRWATAYLRKRQRLSSIVSRHVTRSDSTMYLSLRRRWRCWRDTTTDSGSDNLSWISSKKASFDRLCWRKISRMRWTQKPNEHNITTTTRYDGNLGFTVTGNGGITKSCHSTVYTRKIHCFQKRFEMEAEVDERRKKGRGNEEVQIWNKRGKKRVRAKSQEPRAQ
jgi:hypothetical protein